MVFFGGGGGGGGDFYISPTSEDIKPHINMGGGEESFGPGPGKSGGLDISLANWGASFQTWTGFFFGGGGGMTLLGKVSETWKLHINSPLFRPGMFLG